MKRFMIDAVEATMTRTRKKKKPYNATPGARPRHRPVAFAGPLGKLVEAFGTSDALAKALASSPRTLRRWAQGKGKPSMAAGKLLVMIGRKHGVTEEELRPILEGRGSIYPETFTL
jgi:DNA-binding transcriptional regulator YdaS (Cro superfamily)